MYANVRNDNCKHFDALMNRSYDMCREGEFTDFRYTVYCFESQ